MVTGVSEPAGQECSWAAHLLKPWHNGKQRAGRRGELGCKIHKVHPHEPTTTPSMESPTPNATSWSPRVRTQKSMVDCPYSNGDSVLKNVLSPTSAHIEVSTGSLYAGGPQRDLNKKSGVTSMLLCKKI